MVVHALKEHDLIGRLHFYSQFLQSVHDGEVEPHLVFFFYWGLVFIILIGEFLEQPVLEYRKSRTYELPRHDE